MLSDRCGGPVGVTKEIRAREIEREGERGTERERHRGRERD